MAEKLDPQELVSFKEMLLNEVITSEAIISKRELMGEMKRVQATMVKADK